MNQTLIGLGVANSAVKISGSFLLKYSGPQISALFIIYFLFGVFDHSVKTSIISHFLSMASVEFVETNFMLDIKYNWIVFDGIRCWKGGCILYESAMGIEVNHYHFLDTRCEEGVILYVGMLPFVFIFAF